jgi:acetoin utilization deacetylase AcuC-like enzyme
MTGHSDYFCVVDDPVFERHHAAGPHPERPERLVAARSALRTAKLQAKPLTIPARYATNEELARVHWEPYLTQLDQAAGQSGYFDADTYHSTHSVEAAKRAAGGAIEIVDALHDGASFGVGLLRPPGHHARPSGAMGFCLLNNAAVAAAHARAAFDERIAIVDWDVHHGNGTQEIFYDDPNVLYVSLHQYPFYPGTGSADETGVGDGTGFTVNVPLRAGATPPVYLAAFERIVVPVVEQFAPDLLLVSAGFDAHSSDPLASMLLDGETFGAFTTMLASTFAEPARGRVALLLEGGYNLAGLEDSLKSSLEALDRAVRGSALPVVQTGALDRDREDELRGTAESARRFWKLG